MRVRAGDTYITNDGIERQNVVTDAYGIIVSAQRQSQVKRVINSPGVKFKDRGQHRNFIEFRVRRRFEWTDDADDVLLAFGAAIAVFEATVAKPLRLFLTDSTGMWEYIITDAVLRSRVLSTNGFSSEIAVEISIGDYGAPIFTPNVGEFLWEAESGDIVPSETYEPAAGQGWELDGDDLIPASGAVSDDNWDEDGGDLVPAIP